tara:strand:+ start:7482 stop:7748 length:267 start_codon:yes stop_codon:yes gene_type:complete
MADTLVRLEGAQEVIVDRLTKTGVYKNRSEVIRAGVLELGEKYKVFKNLRDIEDELAVKKMNKIWKEVKQGKRKILSEQDVKKKYGFK